MKVFICWSGEPSKSIADHLASFLKEVIQALRPFVSQHTESGEDWPGRIGNELRETHYGILCLTPDNTTAPWIMYEAGALAKTAGAHVTPLLFAGLVATDLQGPLSLRQARAFGHDEILRLLKDINRLLDDEALDDQTLQRTFERAWPDLESAVNDALEAHPIAETERREERELVEEVLARVRAIEGLLQYQRTTRVRGVSFPRHPNLAEALVSFGEAIMSGGRGGTTLHVLGDGTRLLLRWSRLGAPEMVGNEDDEAPYSRAESMSMEEGDEEDNGSE